MANVPPRLALVCRKGGVGKTTSTVQLARSLAGLYGIRVLVVDNDPQANAGARLGVAEGEAARTMNDVYSWALGARGALSDAIHPTKWDGIDVVVSEEALKYRESEGDADIDYRLQIALDRSTGLDAYGLIIIDTLPGTGSLLRNALIAADGMLAVTDPETDGLKGAQKAVESAAAIASRQNPSLQTLGILVNRFDGAVGEHKRCIDDLIAAYGDLVWRPWIPERAAVKTARGLKIPVQSVKGSGAREFALCMDDHARHLVAAMNLNLQESRR